MAVLFDPPELSWSLDESVRALGDRARVCASVEDIVEHVEKNARRGDHVLIMSNGAFGDIHRKLIDRLQERHG